jgi:hypothetical protein
VNQPSILPPPATPVAARGRLSRRLLPLAAPRLQSSQWLLRYLGVEIACQVALLFPSIAGSRVVIRTAAFASSLLLVMFLPGPREDHPARKFAVLALSIVGLSIFHPDTNNLATGVGTFALTLAILGPIFWVPRIRVDVGVVRKLFLVFWLFQAASAAMGVLQVYFPGRFQPAMTTVYQDQSYINGLQITLANGDRVFRPMGLTDVPGGAGIGAVYTILFSCAFLLDRPRAWFRALLLGSLFLACFTLYLCQVRAFLVILAAGFAAMIGTFIYQRRVGRLFAIAVPVGAVATAAFLAAVAVGGNAVTDRIGTLFASDPGEVYYSNRGMFLQHTFVDLLPDYPIGAGLGRWGMITSYFGERNPSSPPIWVEIQWTGWLLDGGVLLMILYGAALVVTIGTSLRMAGRRSLPGEEELSRWAAVLAMYGVSVLALTFSSCPFAGTLGIDFWLLNITVFAASRQLARPEPAN